MRRFGITDDGSVSELFFSAELPAERAVARAIKQLRGVPSSVKPATIAAVVLAATADSDGKRDILLPPLENAPVLSIKSQAELSGVAERITVHLRHAVEHQGLWRELWDGAKPAPERRCQSLFKLAATAWCQPYNIDLTAEADIGRGPVDFKMSCGWHSRALLEIKLALNRKYWRGLGQQLPQYMTSERIERGFFVAFVFRSSEERFINEIEDAAAEVSSKTGYQISAIAIDARNDNKQSASRL